MSQFAQNVSQVMDFQMINHSVWSVMAQMLQTAIGATQMNLAILLLMLLHVEMVLDYLEDTALI